MSFIERPDNAHHRRVVLQGLAVLGLVAAVMLILGVSAIVALV